MKLNKFFAVILSLALLTASMGTVDAAAEERKLSVVTTIFPIYDWVRQVAGDTGRVGLTMLLDSGVDLHSYQPTAADIMKVAACDVFIYVGGESDEWVEDALREAVNPDMIVISLLDSLGDAVRMEEIVEGMEHGHDHDEDDHEHDDHDHDEDEHDRDEHDHDEDEHDHDDHDHDEDEHDHDEHDHDHEHGEEADEHVWLSLRNAQLLVNTIALKLAGADPAHAEAYQANAAAYCEALSALDRQYAETVEQAAYRTILFGDRFPFRYLADDYSLAYYAAFSGCSAEVEASFQTIVFLAQKVDELGLPAVLTIEGTNRRIAETVIQATSGRNQKLLTLDSMQGVTAADVQAGATYLSIMQANLDVLKEALN